MNLEVCLEVTERMVLLEKQGGNPGRLENASQGQSQASCAVLVSLVLPSSVAYEEASWEGDTRIKG